MGAKSNEQLAEEIRYGLANIARTGKPTESCIDIKRFFLKIEEATRINQLEPGKEKRKAQRRYARAKSLVLDFVRQGRPDLLPSQAPSIMCIVFGRAPSGFMKNFVLYESHH